MTGRYKNDLFFWFTSFHELGRILLHGKKDIFFEDIKYADKQKEKEEEADACSSRILLSQPEEKEDNFAGIFFSRYDSALCEEVQYAFRNHCRIHQAGVFRGTQLFDRGIYLVHGQRANMKNGFMSMCDRIKLRKRCIIEYINDLLKDKANILYSRHSPIHNFIVNTCSVLTVFSFFENKLEALSVHVERTTQLTLF